MKHTMSIHPKAKRAFGPPAIALATLLLSGCQTIPAYKQGLLSKPNMSFENEMGDSMSSSLLSQIEPGSESSNGGQNAGCIACR